MIIMLSQNKKGIIEGWKTVWSIVVGLLLVILGLLPLLNRMGLISWQIPTIPRAILEGVLVIAGIYLIVDGFFELGMHPSLASVSLLAGFVVAAIGMISFLGNLGIISLSLSFIPDIIIRIVIILCGILIFFGSFMF